MVNAFDEELKRIAAAVRALTFDRKLQPHFLPDELQQAVMAYPGAGGKAMRPALLTWAYRALGGENEDIALRAGTAVELYHTYTLIHDDVIDRDPLRRGKPSVHMLMSGVGWKKFGLTSEAGHYGLSMAILAGDAMHSWSISLLSSIGSLGADCATVNALICKLEGDTGPAIVEGEVRDIQLPYALVANVTDDEVLTVMRTKTAALFAFCAWAGGMLARNTCDNQVQNLTDYATEAGVAFQLQDDVLGIIGDEQTLGKPIGSDLREGKRTLIITKAWSRADENGRNQISAALGNPRANPEQIAAATEVLVKTGAVDEVRDMSQNYMQSAIIHLNKIPANPWRDLMNELAERMIARKK
jgi:geranylgeranyl diphosphate synthase type I